MRCLLESGDSSGVYEREQISQIRNIEATSKLTETLDAVRLGQSLTTASTLIGKQVEALTEDGDRVVGTVESATLGDSPRVIVNGEKVPLNNISSILPPSE